MGVTARENASGDGNRGERFPLVERVVHTHNASVMSVKRWSSRVSFASDRKYPEGESRQRGEAPPSA